jgi:hypothetical protein
LSSRPLGQVDHAWRTYSSTELGFSLRYPTDLFEPDVWALDNGDPDRLTFVDFLARALDPEHGHTKALRIAVRQHAPNSALPPPGFYRRFRDFKELSIGGRTAAQHVSCGRAACQWSIEVVVGSREFSIFTMDPDETAKSGPDNERYPLVPMIESIAFEPTPSK